MWGIPAKLLKPIAATALVGTLTLAGFAFLGPGDRGPAKSLATVNAPRVVAPDPGLSRTAQEGHDNGGTSAQLRALEQRLRILEARTVAPEDSRNSRTRDGEEGEESTANANREDLRRAQIQRLDRILGDESYDAGWSTRTEELLATAFEQRGFEGSALQGTRCGATFCRLSVGHRDFRSQAAFEAFTPKVGRMGAIMLLTTSAEGEPETTMYLVRKEFDFPNHPVRQMQN